MRPEEKKDHDSCASCDGSTTLPLDLRTARWAPHMELWGPYKWPCTWVTGIITPISGDHLVWFQVGLYEKEDGASRPFFLGECS